MTAPRTARAASILMWGGHAAAFAGFVLGYNEINPVRGLRWVVLLSVGVFGLCIFASEMIERRSDAGIEVGLAHLAWGVVALATVVRLSSVTAMATVAIVDATFLALLAVMHIAVMFKPVDARDHSAAIGPILEIIMSSAIFWFALTAMHAPVR
jgi:hypothetical protein